MAEKRFSGGKTFLACFLALVIGFLAAFLLYTYLRRPSGGDVYVSGDLSFHFMELGNKYAGDSIYIKAGDADILIDAGSRASSTETTSAYIDQYCIDFPLTDKDSQTYENYVAQRDAEVEAGAVHYTALECYNNENGAQRVYQLSDGVEMEILYNYFYENRSADENNYSVCLLFNQGDKHFLFTGDLEEEGEEYLVQYNELPEVELFKAGHHGSKTSSNDCLLSVIRPKIVCVCCCAGTDEYTDEPANQFPTQDMIDRVAKYTGRVYVTSLGDESAEDGFVSMNGNIVVTSNRSGVSVRCSNNDVLLKDTDWFKANRTAPSQWQ